MKPLLLIILIAVLPCRAIAAEFKLLHRHGGATENRVAARKGSIEFASWVDGESIVFVSRAGNVSCISVNDGQIQWTLSDVGEIRDWSVSRKTKRLAYLTRTFSIVVIDCTTGKTILKVGRDRLARLLSVDYAFPCRLAITPNDGRLIVCTYSTFYGRNGHIFDSTCETLLSSFHIDASPNEITVAPKGDRIAIVADKHVLCLRDVATDRDIYFRGARILKKPDSITVTADAPFFSHLRDSGGQNIVYTLDDSWGTGKVFVRNIKTKKVTSFDARNGHIELDVSFPARRIALTGTSTDLTLLDFDGKLLAHMQKATMRRNTCVEFSPNGKRLLVGSRDNTLSVFDITE